MRIAIVCPYSWTYPGGVSEHIAGLAESLIQRGHDVTVFAPWDPPDRRSRVLHRASVPQTVPMPSYLVPLGRTIGIRANGAVSNLSLSPRGVVRLVRALRGGNYDVVHIHEPDAPILGWAAAYGATSARVGTFHTYNEHRVSHALGTLLGVRLVLNRLHVRIAVSEAAAWTGRRFFGGRYRIVPNGVQIDDAPTGASPTVGAPRDAGPSDDPDATSNGSGRPTPLRIVFVGQPVERKGLPTLLRAFEALRERIPCELTLIGPTSDDIGPLMLDPRDVRALGKVDDDRKRAELRAADVLCAPSTGGESFGMVLTEAFAAGTPVVVSDIPGYRDLVEPGVDGLLVPPRDPQTLAETLMDLAEDPGRCQAMGEAATRAAARYAWAQVSSSVLEAYADARSTPAPAGRRQRIAARLGLSPADLQPRVPPRRLPSLQAAPAASAGRRAGPARRALSAAALIIVAVLCWLAIRKIGLHSVTAALKHTSVPWVVLGVVVMSAAMVLRAVSWHAALRAAMPRSNIRLVDAARGLFLGVLVSSTLPANLGEPSRVLVVARRTERPWESVPIVAGTMMSQSLLNVAFVLILGLVTLASVNLGTGTREGLVAGAVAAVAALVVVLAAPQLLRRARQGSRLQRLWIIAGRVRAGLTVFRRPRLAISMVGGQVGAWTLQWLGVYLILVGTRLGGRAGPLGAVAVLCAVNVTLVLPATPGDVGVFQAAASAVLHAGWHIPYADGIAYGVVLQAAELVTAIVMGLPALLREGLSWRHIGSVTAAAIPVTLPAPGRPTAPGYRLAHDGPSDDSTHPAAPGR